MYNQGHYNVQYQMVRHYIQYQQYYYFVTTTAPTEAREQVERFEADIAIPIKY